MKMGNWTKAGILLLLTCLATALRAQVAVQVQDALTGEPLPGATVMLAGTTVGATTDEGGWAQLRGAAEGSHVLQVQLGGYEPHSEEITLPVAEVVVRLQPVEGEVDEIIIEGTRSNRSIAAMPTRVEALTEEIDEASTMDPSKIAHLITHSTGIQVQQTSATSNTANVRIQGMDGRYTQLLKDGFPLYGGFSGSLSIMQIPPLDLRQVEYIKGGASTLYGGGAISGLINLISKDPSKEETLLHLNASHLGAVDVNAFLSRRMGRVGFTLLAQRNSHRWFDADGDGFTDLPELLKYNLNPKVFLYPDAKTQVSLGATLTTETRKGGDVDLMGLATPLGQDFYREENEVHRNTTQLKAERELAPGLGLALRNSFNFFDRAIAITPGPLQGNYRFAGRQVSSFSELALSLRRERHVLVGGVNVYTDDFREERLMTTLLRDEHYRTAGAFANYVGDLGKWLSVEAGFRGDYVVDEGFFALPRLSALFKWAPKLTTRVGGGMGYRNATVFNPEAEVFAYRDVLPVDRAATHAERSVGGNADIGYKTPLGEHCFLNVNQMFFLTQLDAPLVLADTGGGSGVYAYSNADGFIQSYGAETFFKFGFYDFVFFAGYTYTHATQHFGDSLSPVTLTPRHSLKGDLLYALPGKWRIGLDYEYKGRQPLADGSESPDFWTFGAVVEYTWRQLTLFGNVENYTNVRQTRYRSLVGGPYGTPQFTEVWGPLDGIVFNGGIKLRL